MDNRKNGRGRFQMDAITPAYIASESVRVSCMRILYWDSDYPQFENDAKKIAAALLPYLDETPIDSGWLSACCDDMQDAEERLHKLFEFPAEAVLGMPAPRLATRGAVRALCAVLRIPFNDIAPVRGV